MKILENSLEVSKRWLMKLGLILVAFLWLILMGSYWAQAENREPSSTDSSSVSGSEYKFDWLDPEKKIYVLQNRKFLKANHLQLSFMTGTGLSSPYMNEYPLTPRVAYYFQEDYGIEVFYDYRFNTLNNTYRALTFSSPNALPVIREFRSVYGLNFHWSPWYAKINVFNEIIYFDWYFLLGLGQASARLDTKTSVVSLPVFVNKNYLAFFLGTGHQFHLTQNFVVRWELTDMIYRGQVYGVVGDETWFSNITCVLGLGYRL